MRYILFLIFSLISQFLFAQLIKKNPDTYVGISYGRQLGSSYIQHQVYGILIVEEYIWGNAIGAHFRHFADKKDKKINTGFQFSLQYSEKGWRQKFLSELLIDQKATTRMNYIMLPIEAIIAFGGDKNQWYIGFGAFGEYLIDYQIPSIDISGLSEFEDFYTFDPVKDRFWGYGALGRFGYQRDIGIGFLTIEGSFTYSISNFIYTSSLSSSLPTVSNLYAVVGTIGYLWKF